MALTHVPPVTDIQTVMRDHLHHWHLHPDHLIKRAEGLGTSALINATACTGPSRPSWQSPWLCVSAGAGEDGVPQQKPCANTSGVPRGHGGTRLQGCPAAAFSLRQAGSMGPFLQNAAGGAERPHSVSLRLGRLRQSSSRLPGLPGPRPGPGSSPLQGRGGAVAQARSDRSVHQGSPAPAVM